MEKYANKLPIELINKIVKEQEEFDQLDDIPLEDEPSLKYDDIRFGFSPVVVLGLEDDVIDPAKSEDLLEQMEIECEIERVKGLGHRIPFDVFVDIYNKYVI